MSYILKYIWLYYTVQKWNAIILTIFNQTDLDSPPTHQSTSAMINIEHVHHLVVVIGKSQKKPSMRTTEHPSEVKADLQCSRLANNGACSGDHMNFLLLDNKVYLDLDLQEMPLPLTHPHTHTPLLYLKHLSNPQSIEWFTRTSTHTYIHTHTLTHTHTHTH